jgi:hypothetical protein
MKGIDNKLISTVYGRGRGYVLTLKNFSALGDFRAIGMALIRLCPKGTTRRLARGLHDYPRRHSKLGILSPFVDAVARALQGSDATHLQEDSWKLLTEGKFSRNLFARIVITGDLPGGQEL